MQYVIATHNAGKLAEIARILAPLGIDAITVEGLSDPEENGITFAENAYIKAAAACRETGLPAVADDSGLCVDALDGEPGVYTARYAPVGQRKATVLKKLEGLPRPERTARFVAAVCCVFPDGRIITVEGTKDISVLPAAAKAVSTTIRFLRSRTAAPLQNFRTKKRMR